MQHILKYIIAAALSLAAGGVYAQVKLRGTVTDATNNEPVIGAAVSVTGEHTGGLTDLDGKFQIEVKALPATIEVKFVGYRDQLVDVYETGKAIDIQLVESASLLSEVVVVGYGTQKRQELTSAISTVNKDILKQAVIPSVESALAGTVSGLNVSQTSGQPGAASTVRIRGGNSITGGNEPLYVIDGFIIYNDTDANRTGAGRTDATLDPLSFINPADIESIEVLKDVSATAIYGTRGSNGVIIITTKQGRRGRNNISYQASFGWQNIRRKVKFLNAREWTELYNEIRTYEAETCVNQPKLLNVPSANYDWQDAALQTGFIEEHQISVVGGDEKSQYTFSGNYKNQSGIILGTGLKRYGGRVNYERDVLTKLRVGVNASGAINQLEGLRNQNGNNTPNTWISAISTPPIRPVHTTDGGFNYEPYILTSVSYNGIDPNTISDLVNVQSLTENLRVLTIGFAEYKLRPGLKLKASLGLDLSNTKQSNYAPSYTSSGAANNGVASIGQKSVYTWQTEYTASYNTLINRVHSISVLLGYTAQRTDRRGVSGSSYNFSNDATGYNNLASGGTAYWPTSEAHTSTLQSWLGRTTYSYGGRYNITATLRADGSSRFAKTHQWGYFPSLGVSWNMDKESFINLPEAVTFVQLRASGGVVGNQEIGDFRYIANVVPQTYYFGSKPATAYVVENLANPDLKWESTASYNAGLSVGFLDGRLNVVFDTYYKKTSDLLLNAPVEATTGFSTAMRNIGSVSNKGLELEISGTPIQGKIWNWRISMNAATNVNCVESLGNAESFLPPFDGIGTLQYMNPLIVKKGEPLGSLYGYKFAGIVQKDDDISKLPPQSTEALAPGVVKYEDVSGPDGVPDGKVNELDRTILGNSQPRLTGGFNSTLTYKGLDFFVSVQGSYGNKLLNTLAARFEKTSTSYNSLKTVLDRWTPTNPSNRIGKASNSTSIVTDDRYVEDASYLRLKNVTLGYTLPLKRLTVDAKLRLFLSLQNFVTLTGYTGYDPESNRNGVDESNGLYQGVDFGTYPSSRTIQIGFNLTL